MSEYFEHALHNFVKDFNYSGAIAHLTDQSYTLRQIRERLGANLSDSFLSEQMIKAYIESEYMRIEEPGLNKREKKTMIRETGPYGRVSYRQVRETIEVPGLPLTGRVYQPATDGELSHFLWEKAVENEHASYLSMRISHQDFQKWKEILDRDQMEFLECFLSVNKIFYLKMDHRMISIVKHLYEKGFYEGCAYYLNIGRKWIINQKNV